MKSWANFYCTLCWQEMEHPSEHDRGSFYGKLRLNGHCPGDIRPMDGPRPARVRREPAPLLNLDAGEPINVGTKQ